MTTTNSAAMASPPGASPADGATRAVRGWLDLVSTVASRAYRAFFLTLVVIALLPIAWSWHSYVVESGSMEPGISRGDLVVAKPWSRHAHLPLGRVLVFDPPGDGSAGLRVHRVVEYRGHGKYVTAGDANPDPDATLIASSDVRARAMILVPYVGLPVTWVSRDAYLPLGLWLAGTVFAFGRAGRESVRGRRRRRVPPALALVVVAGVASSALARSSGHGASTADAAFTAQTRSAGNTWTFAAAIAARYTTAVLADRPLAFYLLDERGGASAADTSGNSRTGTYSAISAYGRPDALPNNPGTAVALGAVGNVVIGGPSVSDPNEFSLEMWFRTTTTVGGKLVGFESTRGSASAQYDRHVFMRPDGRLVYGGWDAPQVRTITTPKAYNDGAWHHLALAAVPHGTQQDAVLYVDGTPVVSGTTTRTSPYAGWWRFGYGRLPTGTGYPAQAGFAGDIDQAAIYTHALSAQEVASHYAAR
jgi:signal peptidase I